MKIQTFTTITTSETKQLTFAQKRLLTRLYKFIGLIHYPFVLLHEFSHAFFLLLGGIKVGEIKVNICRFNKIRAYVLHDGSTVNNLWRLKCAMLCCIAPIFSFIILWILSLYSLNSIFIFLVISNFFALCPSKPDMILFKYYKRKHHLLKLLKK